MGLGNSDDRVTSRRRLSRDEALRAAQEIIRRHVAGESVRTIARAVQLPRTSVHRVIQDYRRAQLDAEVDAEAATALAKYDGAVCLVRM
jgi:NADH:ubiquinone oxidoreductase subunit E